MTDKIAEVDVDLVKPAPFQPRQLFSEGQLQELGDSIQEIGLIHPPVVRAIYSGEKFLYYELIAGERRLRAVKQMGQSKINVLLRESSDAEAAKASLIENVQRVNLNPIEVAQSYKQLLSAFHMTQEQVAKQVGKKRSTVANYLRLLTLPEDIQRSLAEKKISLGHAKTLLALDNSQEQKELKEKIETEKLTVRDAEKKTQQITNTTPDCHLQAYEKQLEELLGTRVDIRYKKDGAGTITLHFYSHEDFERLHDHLKT